MAVSKPRTTKAVSADAQRRKAVDKAKQMEACIKYIKDKQADGKTVSFRTAGKLYSLPHSSVCDAYHGALPKTYAHTDQQILSPERENVLVEWVKHWGARGAPMTKHNIRLKAGLLAGKEVGQNWIYGFIRRHNDQMKSKMTNKLDSARARQLNPAVVKDFYDKLIAELIENRIPPENIFNADEKGIICGSDEPVKVFISRSQRSATMITQMDREITTIMECVCADGTSIPPMFIFKGVRQSKLWRADNDLGLNATVATSPNGWTDQELGVLWMKKVFEPETSKKCDKSAPRLLIIDGHNSHTTVDFLEYADKHNIIVLCLPPHTTHHLQPCDVSVFSPLSKAWKRLVDESFELGIAVTRYNLIKIYARARRSAFKDTTIHEAFRKTGIWPPNPDALPAEAYGPSRATTIQLNLPGFPDPLFPNPLPPTATTAASDNASTDIPSPLDTEADQPIQNSDTVANSTTEVNPIDHPPAAFGLEIPSAFAVSALPKQSKPTADRAELWRAYIDSCELNAEMAKWIDANQGWMQLMQAENTRLRNLCYAKQNKPKGHFLNTKARVLTKPEILELIHVEEETARQKATKGKKKGKTKGKKKGKTPGKENADAMQSLGQSHAAGGRKETGSEGEAEGTNNADESDNDGGNVGDEADYVPKRTVTVATRTNPPWGQQRKQLLPATTNIHIVVQEVEQDEAGTRTFDQDGSSSSEVTRQTRTTRCTENQPNTSEEHPNSPRTLNEAAGADIQPSEESIPPMPLHARPKKLIRRHPRTLNIQHNPNETLDDFFTLNPAARSDAAL